MKLVKVGKVIINLEKVTDYFFNDQTLTISFTDRVETDFFGSEAEWLWLKLKLMCVYNYEQEMEDRKVITELEEDQAIGSLEAVANYVNHVIKDTEELVK